MTERCLSTHWSALRMEKLLYWIVQSHALDNSTLNEGILRTISCSVSDLLPIRTRLPTAIPWILITKAKLNYLFNLRHNNKMTSWSDMTIETQAWPLQRRQTRRTQHFLLIGYSRHKNTRRPRVTNEKMVIQHKSIASLLITWTQCVQMLVLRLFGDYATACLQ